MMPHYVTDTQALVKYLTGQRVINERIHHIFQMTEVGEAVIIVPNIVLFEIGYLHQKGRIPVSLAIMEQVFAMTDYVIEKPVNLSIIKKAFEIDDIPELHDKLIAGMAYALDVPILTNDPVILASQFVKYI